MLKQHKPGGSEAAWLIKIVYYKGLNEDAHVFAEISGPFHK